MIWRKGCLHISGLLSTQERARTSQQWPPRLARLARPARRSAALELVRACQAQKYIADLQLASLQESAPIVQSAGTVTPAKAQPEPPSENGSFQASNGGSSVTDLAALEQRPHCSTGVAHGVDHVAAPEASPDSAGPAAGPQQQVL